MSSNQDYVETMILELSECLRELVDLQPHQYDDRWETAMQNAYELLNRKDERLTPRPGADE